MLGDCHETLETKIISHLLFLCCESTLFHSIFKIIYINRVIEGDYVPRGHIINIGNLPIYVAPDNANSNRMLIIIHDIFGFGSSNLRQVADVMALQSNGFRVVLPDFFRGEGWDRNWPVE